MRAAKNLPNYQLGIKEEKKKKLLENKFLFSFFFREFCLYVSSSPSISQQKEKVTRWWGRGERTESNGSCVDSCKHFLPREPKKKEVEYPVMKPTTRKQIEWCTQTEKSNKQHCELITDLFVCQQNGAINRSKDENRTTLKNWKVNAYDQRVDELPREWHVLNATKPGFFFSGYTK